MHNRPHTKTNVLQAVAEQPAAAMNGKMAQPLLDNRPAAIMQKKQLTGMNNNSGTAIPVQKKANKTGLPDQLKSGVENLSGIAMDDVKVHYGSSKPAQVQAHAYAQGSDIHIAPGQEKHLPHEAWHVAQQKQGRVKPTKQLKSKVNINDDKGLETEADVMGRKALTQRFALHSDDTLQRAYNNMGVNPCSPLSPVQLYKDQALGAKTGLPGGALVTQLWEWGDLFNAVAKILPGLFVMTEGGLSLAMAYYQFHANPLNMWQAVPSAVVGGLKLLRGLGMVINAIQFPSEATESMQKRTAIGKGIIDTIRLVEGLVSGLSVLEGSGAITSEHNKLVTQVTGGLFACIKIIRSCLHFLEAYFENKYKSTIVSTLLQGVESLEGIIVAIGGGLSDPVNKLGIATGASKFTRGLIGGGNAIKKGKDKYGGGQARDIENQLPNEQTSLTTSIKEPLILNNEK